MDLGLSEDQQAIAEVFASFFSRESPSSVVRAAAPLGFSGDLWHRLRETGAPGMGAPSANGGGGAETAELVVVAEALGAAIAPVPLVEHVVASRVYPAEDLVEGRVVATIALWPADGDGTWRLAPAGAVADVVVGIDGDEVVAVRSEAPGKGPRNHGDAPLADRSARTGQREVLGPATMFEVALREWRILTAATLVGMSAAALRMGLAYVSQRHAFGRPIGSYQAVQHGLADVAILHDGARLLTHKAAWAEDQGRDGGIDVGGGAVTDRTALASMAFVFAAETAATATDRSLHYHGGYGFSEEYDIQLYYRRARAGVYVFDDPTRDVLRLADVLLGA